MKNWKLLERLKKSDKRMFFVILFDVLFYASLVVIVLLAIALISTNMKKIEQFTPLLQKSLPNLLEGKLENLPNQADLREVKEATALFKSIIITSKIIIGGAFVLIALLSIFFRSLIWSKILKIKFSRKYFKKYFLLNIGWIVGWGIVLFLLTVVFKQEALPGILGAGIVIYLYFTVILRSLFDEKKSSIKTLKQTSRISVKKIHKVIYQCIPVIVVGALLAVLFKYMNLRGVALGNFIITTSALSIIYFAWVRIFISGAVKKIES